MKQNTLVCQFASPLDVDTHIKPETTILEGKYWKRRAEAVKAEYKKWRMYYRNKAFGCSAQDVSDVISDMDVLDWQYQDNTHMLVDEDYLALMTDTLFSTISNNQPFAFPDTREIARGAVIADFIQPSLGPLQPNLEDYMDTLEPLHELLNSAKLPPVPEETVATDDALYRNSQSFNPTLMNSNYQPQQQQTSQYSLSQQQMAHVVGLQATMDNNAHRQQQQQQQHQSVLQNSTVLTRQQPHPQAYNISSTASADLSNASVITQNQSQSMMLQPYNMMNSNMMSAQNLSSQQQQSSNGQELQKSHQYGMQPQKIYPQMASAGYSDRNYLSQHIANQSRVDNFVANNSRRGNGGCIRERVSRQRPSPFVPPPPPPVYNQFSPSSSSSTSSGVPKAEKYDHNLIAAMSAPVVPQNISLTAGIYLSNINQIDQSVSRFKMPSPPPQQQQPQQQMGSGNIIGVPQVAPNLHPQGGQAASESFRSNSLPIGASLGTMLGVQRVRRRPRSGSSSPAPPRRAPPPLAATATQEMYKGSNYQSTSAENVSNLNPSSQITFMAVPAIAPKAEPPSPQLSNFNSGSSTGALSPQSPSSPLDGSGREHKRSGHIHAEQKRRYNIKNGFDVLQSLIPQLSQNPTAKVSKAAMLQKGAEYIKQLQNEMNQIKEETDGLRQQIDCLNNSISNCQSLLPATGAPVSRQRSGKLKEMFDDYVCQRTNENWKFWIFSIFMEPLLASFNNCVSPASTEELKRSTLLWAEQHCSLVELRPAVLNSMHQLYSTTDILTDPSKLPDEARAAVGKKKYKDSKSSSK